MTTWILSAQRSAVVPKGGALRNEELWDIAAPVLRACLAKVGAKNGSDQKNHSIEDFADVIMGNALYGGGNPARLAALKAGLPAKIPGLTIDDQCCSGLTALCLGHHRIAAKNARMILAGGAESYSRQPQRSHLDHQGQAKPYDQPPFSPPPEPFASLHESAAALAKKYNVSRKDQETWSIESHHKARGAQAAGKFEEEITPILSSHIHQTITHDPTTRHLSETLCARAPSLVSDHEAGITTATTALAADAAAFVLLGDDSIAEALAPRSVLRFVDGITLASDPAYPALAPIHAVRALWQRYPKVRNRLGYVEIMEAYAVQAILTCRELALPAQIVNCDGGALARGHPIGASGAVLAVRLFHRLKDAPAGTYGLATIAAAGGLGCAILVQKV